nr:MAG TPA: hypothetical protein [Caudoviricetes sp.]
MNSSWIHLPGNGHNMTPPPIWYKKRRPGKPERLENIWVYLSKSIDTYVYIL